MIAAIRYRPCNAYGIVIYTAGTYQKIDWENENHCNLGAEYSVFSYKPGANNKQYITIKPDLNGNNTLRLLETIRYTLKLENDEQTSIELPHFQNQHNKFIKCDTDKDSLTFQFVNYLGHTRLIFQDGLIIPFDIVPDKINYEDDYIKLTESIAEACSELLLDYSGATYLNFTHKAENPNTLLEQFIFIRAFCLSDNLQELFGQIKNNPDRTLVQEEELKPIGVFAPSKKFYSNPFTHSQSWQINRNNNKLNYLPAKIAVTQKIESLDTPANRFIFYALNSFDQICTALLSALDINGSQKQVECYKEAQYIHAILGNILNDPFFSDISPLIIMPQNNQVLQKRSGYRQIFNAYSMMDLALQLDWKGNDQAYEGESKNVALLYEYWLFFELFNIIKSIDGCTLQHTTDTPFMEFTEEGLCLSLSEGQRSCQSFSIDKWNTTINLYYNRTFSQTEFQSTNYEGSYSRPFRPDYTLAIFPSVSTKAKYNGEGNAIAEGTVSYIHFDAKYRITDLSSFIGNGEIDSLSDDELADEKAESIINTYKRGDLLKMHTYCDAIRRTIGSYILYPGSNNKASTYSIYDEILPGVGAFSVKPSNKLNSEAVLSRFIASFVEEKSHYYSRLSRMNYFNEMIIREPSITRFHEMPSEKFNQDQFIIGYLRSEEPNNYFAFLKTQHLLCNGCEFWFYFYAIQNGTVYAHHKDLSHIQQFRFYTNNITNDNYYAIQPYICEVLSNELVSKDILVTRLQSIGMNSDAKAHNADFYYIMRIRVINDKADEILLPISVVDNQNGNNAFSPWIPRIINLTNPIKEANFNG